MSVTAETFHEFILAGPVRFKQELNIKTIEFTFAKFGISVAEIFKF